MNKLKTAKREEEEEEMIEFKIKINILEVDHHLLLLNLN
jgi:hypothetical protein